MACFAVPAAVGAVTTVFAKRFPARLHIGWLNAMVLGGSAALTVEHFVHGELVPWPPFFTAMSSPASAAVMLHEMAAVGVPMAIALVFAWAVLVLAYDKLAVFKRMSKLQNHKLGFLSLMLCGAFIMVLTDRATAWLTGEPFIEWAASGLFSSSVLLWAAMPVPVLLIWLASFRMPPGGKLTA